MAPEPAGGWSESKSKMEDQMARAGPHAEEGVPLDTGPTELHGEVCATATQPATRGAEDVHAAEQVVLEDVALDVRLAELAKSRIVDGQLFTRERKNADRLCLIFRKEHLDYVLRMLEVDTRMSKQEGEVTSSTSGGFYTYKLQLVFEQKEKRRELFNEVVEMAKQAGVNEANLPKLTRGRQLNLQQMKKLEDLLVGQSGGSVPCSAAAASSFNGPASRPSGPPAVGATSPSPGAAVAAASDGAPDRAASAPTDMLATSRSREVSAGLWRNRATYKCRTSSRCGARGLSQAMAMSAIEVHDMYVLKHYAEQAKKEAEERAEGAPLIDSRHRKTPFSSDSTNEKMVLASKWITGFELTNGTTREADTEVDGDKMRSLRSKLEEAGRRLVAGFELVRHVASLGRNLASHDHKDFNEETFNVERFVEAAETAAETAAEIFQLRFSKTNWIDKLHGGPGAATCGMEPETDVFFKMYRSRCVRLQGTTDECKKARVCVVTFSNSTMASVEVPVGGAHLPNCWTRHGNLQDIPGEQREFIAAKPRERAKVHKFKARISANVKAKVIDGSYRHQINHATASTSERNNAGVRKSMFSCRSTLTPPGSVVFANLRAALQRLESLDLGPEGLRVIQDTTNALNEISARAEGADMRLPRDAAATSQMPDSYGQALLMPRGSARAGTKRGLGRTLTDVQLNAADACTKRPRAKAKE